MIDGHEIAFRGQSYVLHVASSNLSRLWVSKSDSKVVPDEMWPNLDREFISRYVPALVEEAQSDDKRSEILISLRNTMNPTDGELCAAGLEGALLMMRIREDPANAARYLIEILPLPPTGRTPFNCALLRNWYFENRKTEKLTPLRVACLGYGPFEREDFITFVQSHGVSVAAPVASVEHVVIGREGWDEQIDDLIQRHIGRRLKIYSQEMLLSFLANDADPFEGGRLVLEAFRQAHPVLEFLSQGGWPGWVNTVVSKDYRAPLATVETASWNEEHPLHRMGYNVNVPEGERRRILDRAFVGEHLEMRLLGKPNSPVRMKIMAGHIAWLIRSRRHRAEQQNAVAIWDSDLRWLKDTYYDGRAQMLFDWPGTVA